MDRKDQVLRGTGSQVFHGWHGEAEIVDHRRLAVVVGHDVDLPTIARFHGTELEDGFVEFQKTHSLSLDSVVDDSA